MKSGFDVFDVVGMLVKDVVYLSKKNEKKTHFLHKVPQKQQSV